MNIEIREIQRRIDAESALVERILEEVSKVIVGQEYMVRRLLIGLLTNGHVLLEGVPGLAKTLTVKTLSQTIDTGFQRVQFTPDLLPADLIGTLVYDQSDGAFKTKKGPIFSNLILADEINRSPAKVQSALLEAMQERTVTIGETTFPLDDPFLVLATQNPIEQEGTYPLPEAQVDRFMLKLSVGYPSRTEELEIMRRMSGAVPPEAAPVVSPEEVRRARDAVQDIYMDPKIQRYIVDIVFATRTPGECGMDELVDLVSFGGVSQGLHLSGSGGPGPRLPGPPRLCDSGRRSRHRPGRAQAPGHSDLRGGGRRGDCRGRGPKSPEQRGSPVARILGKILLYSRAPRRLETGPGWFVHPVKLAGLRR